MSLSYILYIICSLCSFWHVIGATGDLFYGQATLTKYVCISTVYAFSCRFSLTLPFADTHAHKHTDTYVHLHVRQKKHLIVIGVSCAFANAKDPFGD